MIVYRVNYTAALKTWIEGAHDDEQPALRVSYRGASPMAPSRLTVLRYSGDELSPTEEREVRALLAAHAAEPLKMPTK